MCQPLPLDQANERRARAAESRGSPDLSEQLARFEEHKREADKLLGK
jgi:hypothetical protein